MKYDKENKKTLSIIRELKKHLDKFDYLIKTFEEGNIIKISDKSVFYDENTRNVVVNLKPKLNIKAFKNNWYFKDLEKGEDFYIDGTIKVGIYANNEYIGSTDISYMSYDVVHSVEDKEYTIKNKTRIELPMPNWGKMYNGYFINAEEYESCEFDIRVESTNLYVFDTFEHCEEKISEKTVDDYKPGDDISFGKYYWRILNIEDNKVLLRCNTIVDTMQFDKSEIGNKPGQKMLSWKESDIRKYLNGLFYDETFTLKEKEIIIRSRIKCEKMVKALLFYKTEADGFAEDNIFLLSVEEMEQYLPKKEDRLISCKDNKELMNKYNFSYYMSNDGYLTYWLRSINTTCPKILHTYTSSETKKTEIRYSTSYPQNTLGVVPCLMIDLTKLIAFNKQKNSN